MVKAVVFDAYGTLISTGTGSLDAAQRILDLYGSAIVAKTFYADWKKYHRQHIDSLTQFVPEETIFLWDLEKLYEQYGLEGNAAKDVRIMLDQMAILHECECLSRMCEEQKLVRLAEKLGVEYGE